MKKTFYLLTGVFVIFGAFMLGGNALAAEDVTHPQVTAIEISPPTVDTGDADQVLTLTITLTDDLTGVCINDGETFSCPSSPTELRFRPLIGTQFVDFHEFTRISGDDNNGTYTATAILPQYSKVGLWTVEYLHLIDKIGNQGYLNSTELATMFPNSTLTVANTDDATSVTIEKEWELSSGNIKATFPEGTVVTNSSGGSFQFYKMIIGEYDVEDLVDFGGAVAALEVGIPSVGLSFSQMVEIAWYIEDESLIGENLIIRTYDEEGDQASWVWESYCTVDEEQYCTFTTDHASLFAAEVQPVRAVVTGTKSGGGPEVRVFDTEGTLLENFDAYTNWWGGINVAVGDVNGDGTNDIITSTRVGGIPTVKIFDINGNSLNLDFDAYDSAFRGGINIAVGDIEGDGMDEIVVAPMSGGGPNIRTFGYRNGAMVPVTANFMAYDVNFRGGISLSIGDLEGDGISEIITAPISGGGPHIRVFGMRNKVFVPVTLGVIAYAPEFHGGIVTTMADLNGNGKDEAVTGVYSNGGPHVRAIGIGSNGALSLANPGFMVFSNQFRGGVSVATLDIDGDGTEEIIAGVGGQDVGWIKIVDGQGQAQATTFQAYDSYYKGGVTVAAGVF